MEKYAVALTSESAMPLQTGLIKFKLLVTTCNKEKISFCFAGTQEINKEKKMVARNTKQNKECTIMPVCDRYFCHLCSV